MYEQMGLSSNEDRIVQNSKLEATRRPLDVAAESKDLGDYFEYTLKQSVTIGKNQSALVPILQSRIDAEKVTLWTANSNQPPLRAIWIKNGSGLTLDSGTFNIIDGGTFAGEGLLQTVHPDERRLLSFAADTAVRVTSQSDFKNQRQPHPPDQGIDVHHARTAQQSHVQHSQRRYCCAAGCDRASCARRLEADA